MRKIVASLEDGTGTIDIFYSAIRAQKVTAYMLYLLLKEGDSASPDMCEGISWMLDQQAALLDDILESVETKEDLLNDYRRREAETQAASGADSEKVLGLRRQMIAEAVGHGAEAGEIAAAVNMRRANVEKVIRQLQGERPATQAKAMNG